MYHINIMKGENMERNLSTTIRLSKEELEIIKQNAKRAGLPLATFIRFVSMGGNK